MRVFFDRHPGLDPGSCSTGQLLVRHTMPEALEIPACAGMTDSSVLSYAPCALHTAH